MLYSFLAPTELIITYIAVSDVTGASKLRTSASKAHVTPVMSHFITANHFRSNSAICCEAPQRESITTDCLVR